MTHTPGPWHIVKTEYKRETRVEVLQEGYSKPVARIYQRGTCNGYRYTMPQDANAHLIAAAPDLLDALTRIVDGINDEWHPLFHGPGVMTGEECYALDQAIAAIAKARGEP